MKEGLQSREKYGILYEKMFEGKSGATRSFLFVGTICPISACWPQGRGKMEMMGEGTKNVCTFCRKGELLMAAAKTTDRVWDLAAPVAETLGLSVWDVRFVKEGASWYLRIFIDKPDGIGIEDCEAMSRTIDPLLDEADFISHAYYLEVSSPGLGRELTRPEHYERFTGQEVRVRLIRPVEGKKEYTGVLTNFDGNISLEIDGDKLTLEKGNISHVNLNDDVF